MCAGIPIGSFLHRRVRYPVFGIDVLGRPRVRLAEEDRAEVAFVPHRRRRFFAAQQFEILPKYFHIVILRFSAGLTNLRDLSSVDPADSAAWRPVARAAVAAAVAVQERGAPPEAVEAADAPRLEAAVEARGAPQDAEAEPLGAPPLEAADAPRLKAAVEAWGAPRAAEVEALGARLEAVEVPGALPRPEVGVKVRGARPMGGAGGWPGGGAGRAVAGAAPCTGGSGCPCCPGSDCPCGVDDCPGGVAAAPALGVGCPDGVVVCPGRGDWPGREG